MDIYIDGEYFDKKNAKISVFDHGLLYGDGIFEGIRFYEGRVFKLKEHIQRLFISAKAILLEIEMTQEDGSKKRGRCYVCDLAGTEPAGDIFYAKYEKEH